VEPLAPTAPAARAALDRARAALASATTAADAATTALEAARTAVTEAERAYGPDPTPARWTAVERARRALDQATLAHDATAGGAASRLARAREAVPRAELAAAEALAADAGQYPGCEADLARLVALAREAGPLVARLRAACARHVEASTALDRVRRAQGLQGAAEIVVQDPRHRWRHLVVRALGPELLAAVDEVSPRTARVLSTLAVHYRPAAGEAALWARVEALLAQGTPK
jgi:hypothetical protein